MLPQKADSIDPRVLPHTPRRGGMCHMDLHAHAHAFAHERNARRRMAMRIHADMRGSSSPLESRIHRRRHAWPPPPRPTPGLNPRTEMEVEMSPETIEGDSGICSTPVRDDTYMVQSESNEMAYRGWVLNDREVDAVSAALARFTC